MTTKTFELGRHTVHGTHSVCIDPGVQKVKGQGHIVIKWYSCHQDCLAFLFTVMFCMPYSMINVMIQITVNVIRPLPPSLIVYFDPDEDEPTMEITWPHLSVGGVVNSAQCC